jgi:hypothetical protein
MKVFEFLRNILFHMAANIHPTLGSIFQNEMDISKDDINMEVMRIEAVEAELALYKRNVVKLNKEL